MALEKQIRARQQQKHDIEANWLLAGNKGFVPLEGEIIVYDKDENNSNIRLKVGDGVTTVTNLPFYVLEEIEETRRKTDYLAAQGFSAQWQNDVLVLNKGINFPENLI